MTPENRCQKELSRCKWSPATTGPAGPSMANVVAIDGPAGPSMVTKSAVAGWSVTGIFVLLKKCPRIKIFRKFLSHGIKIFVLGQNISEKFWPRTKIFRKFLSHPNKICPTPKFSDWKDEIRAKASLASQTTFSSSFMAIGKGRKGSLDNKTNYIRTNWSLCAWC